MREGDVCDREDEENKDGKMVFLLPLWRCM